MSIKTFIIALGVLVSLAGPCYALAVTDDYRFASFEANYYLSRDAAHVSHLRVTEHFVAVFPETNQNHGISRTLPETYLGHSIDLRVQSVTDETGYQLPYSETSLNNQLMLQIGDQHRYVHGAQSYNIEYTADNVTMHSGTHDEYIWDPNGDQWAQPFDQVTVKLHLSSELASRTIPDGGRCFTGPHGSTASTCTIQSMTTPESETITTFTATRALEPHETLTNDTYFEGGTFAAGGQGIPGLTPQQTLSTIFVFGGLFAFVLIWRLRHKHEIRHAD